MLTRHHVQKLISQDHSKAMTVTPGLGRGYLFKS